MEEDELYSDLPSFNLKNIEENSTNLALECNELKKEIDKLTKKLAESDNVNKRLEVNMASLLKTAKAEIARKDRMIEDLRRQLDNAAFRRNNFARNTNSSRNLQQQDVQIKLDSNDQTSFVEEDEFEWEHTKQKEALCAAASTVYGERLKKRLMEEKEAEKKLKEELAASNTVQTPMVSSVAPSASVAEEKPPSALMSTGKRINDERIDSRVTKRLRIEKEDVKKEIVTEEQHETAQRSNSWQDTGSRKFDTHRREVFDKKNSRTDKRNGKDYDKRRENSCSDSRSGKKDSEAVESNVCRKEDERRRERIGPHESKRDRRRGRYEKGERGGRYEKSEYNDRCNIDQRNERHVKDERNERNERYEKNLRVNKYEKNEQDKRCEAMQRNDKCERRESDRRIEKCERRERSSEPYERSELMNNANFARERLDADCFNANRYDKTKGREPHGDMHTNKRHRHEKYHIDDTNSKRNRSGKLHFEKSGSTEKSVNLGRAEKKFTRGRSESSERNVNLEKEDRKLFFEKAGRLQEHGYSEQRKQLCLEKNVDLAKSEKKLCSRTTECLEAKNTVESIEKCRHRKHSPDISVKHRKDDKNFTSEKTNITVIGKHDRTDCDPNLEIDKHKRLSPTNISNINDSTLNDIKDDIHSSENSKVSKTNKSKSIDRNNEEHKKTGPRSNNSQNTTSEILSLDTNIHQVKNINYKRDDEIATKTINSSNENQKLLQKNSLKAIEDVLDNGVDVKTRKAVEDGEQVIENSNADRKTDELINSNTSKICTDELNEQTIKNYSIIHTSDNKIQCRHEEKCVILSHTCKTQTKSQTVKNEDIAIDYNDSSEMGQIVQRDTSVTKNIPKIEQKSDEKHITTNERSNTCFDEEVIESIEEFIRISRSDCEGTKVKETFKSNEIITDNRVCTGPTGDNHKSKSREKDDRQQMGTSKLIAESNKLDTSENQIITSRKNNETNIESVQKCREEKLNNSLKEENIERIEEFIQNYSLTNSKDSRLEIQPVEDVTKCEQESILKALSNSDICIEMDGDCTLNSEKCQVDDNKSSRTNDLPDQNDHENNSIHKNGGISTEKATLSINYAETKNVLNNDTSNVKIEKTDKLKIDDTSSTENSLRKSHEDVDKENTNPNLENDDGNCHLLKVETVVGSNITKTKLQQTLQVESLKTNNKNVETAVTPTKSNNVVKDDKIVEEPDKKGDMINNESNVSTINKTENKAYTVSVSVENKVLTKLSSEEELPTKHVNVTSPASTNESIVTVKHEIAKTQLCESKEIIDESANNRAESKDMVCCETGRETEFVMESLVLNENCADVNIHDVKLDKTVNSKIENIQKEEQCHNDDLNIRETKSEFNLVHMKCSKVSTANVHRTEEFNDNNSNKRSSDEVCEVRSECKRLKRMHNDETSNMIEKERNPSRSEMNKICDLRTNNNDCIDKNVELTDTEMVKEGKLPADSEEKLCLVKSQPINILFKKKEIELPTSEEKIDCITHTDSPINEQVDNLSVKMENKSLISNENVNASSTNNQIIEDRSDNGVKIENFPFNNQQIANSSIIIEEIVNSSITTDNTSSLTINSHSLHTSLGQNEKVDNLLICNRPVENSANDNSDTVNLPIVEVQADNFQTVKSQTDNYQKNDQETNISDISSTQKDNQRKCNMQITNLPISNHQINRQGNDSKTHNSPCSTAETEPSSSCNQQIINFDGTEKCRISPILKQQSSSLLHKVVQLETSVSPKPNALPLHSQSSSQVSNALVKIPGSSNFLIPESATRDSFSQKSPCNKRLVNHLPINNPLITSPVKTIELKVKVKKKTPISLVGMTNTRNPVVSTLGKKLLILSTKKTVEIVDQVKSKQSTESYSVSNEKNVEREDKLKEQKEEIKLVKTEKIKLQTKSTNMSNASSVLVELRNVDKLESLEEGGKKLKTANVESDTDASKVESESQAISSEHVESVTNMDDTETNTGNVSLDSSEKFDVSSESSSADTSSSTDSSATTNTSIDSSESSTACSSLETASSTDSSGSNSSSDSVSTNSPPLKNVPTNVMNTSLHTVSDENSTEGIYQDSYKTLEKVSQETLSEDHPRTQKILARSVHDRTEEDYDKCSREESRSGLDLSLKDVIIEKSDVSVESKKVEIICIRETPHKIDGSRGSINSIIANDTLPVSKCSKKTSDSSLNPSKLHNTESTSKDKINESSSKPTLIKIDCAASISSKPNKLTNIQSQVTKAGMAVDLVSDLTSQKICCSPQHTRLANIENILSTPLKQSKSYDLPPDSSISHSVKSTKVQDFVPKCTSLKLVNITDLPSNLSSFKFNKTDLLPPKSSLTKVESSSLSNSEKSTVVPLLKTRNSLPLNSSYKSSGSHDREKSKVIVSVRRRKPVQLGDTNAGMTVIVNANNTVVNTSGSNASSESPLKPRACKMTRSYKDVFLK